VEAALALAALVAGLVNWLLLWRAGLVLSHYDAKAHLVVARRIADNITPGWQQIGGVWLPLPHLLSAIPVQVDVLYRTGAFASIVSIGCLAILVYATARLVRLATGSQRGAAVAGALILLNPNLLYLHATPMTEPLLLAATSLSILWLVNWVPLNQDHVPSRLGWALFATAWTRFEAWFVIAGALAAALFACYRLGASRDALVRRAWRLAAWPAAAVLTFLWISKATTGEWFVAGVFFVPDPLYEGQAIRSAVAVWWGTHQLSTRTTELVAIVTVAIVVARALSRPQDALSLIPVALLMYASLPFLGFYYGHPFRIRYMAPAAAACALFAGMAVGYVRRQASIILAGVLVGVTLLQSPPWWRDAPMLVEAQWDRPASAGRQRVTSCLRDGYRDEKIVASMGSLAHYMQELSREGFDIADFVHEGNGAIWELALETGPRWHAGWMLVEEESEGGDLLARRIREDPRFAAGMRRICEGGGVALYRRLSLP
jgi:hypothetical protein